MTRSPALLRLLDRGRSRWRAARVPWRAWVARRAVSRLAPAVNASREALAQFGELSSQEFTQLAESLGSLDQQLAQIRDHASQLESILQQHDEDRALASAFELYKKSVDLAHASIGIALSQEEEMEQMEHGLLQHRERFAHSNLMFRVLVMNLRTEAARIDPDNRGVFMSVATEMESMERRMSETLQSAFDQLEAIVADAAEGRVQLTSLQTELHEGAQESIRVLRHELDDTKARLRPCATASAEITRFINESRQQAGQLITALQYQDIVRQQIEHVREGLADVADHVAPARGRIDPGYLQQSVKVQQSQLVVSRQAIEQAGREVQQSSAALLECGARLMDSFTDMERVAEQAFRGSRVGELFKSETDKLVATATRGEATNDRIARLLTRIEEAIRVFSDELRGQEFEVHLVALNAQVSAARVPQAWALNKLAEETSLLARQSAELNRAMSDQLSATLSRLNGMRKEADEVRETIGREKLELGQGAVIVGEKLNRLKERIRVNSGEVSRRFTAAYEVIRAQLGALRFPAMIGSSYAVAEECCAGILEVTAGFEPEAANRERLAQHQARYTMKQEREAHAAALATAAAAAAPVVADLGIDLFADAPAAPAADVGAPPAGEPAVADSKPGDVELF